MLDEKDKTIYADSAYSGRVIAKNISKYIKNMVHEKGYKNRPLTKEQKEKNKEKSRIRARVEHVFGYMTKSMNGISIRSIGM